MEKKIKKKEVVDESPIRVLETFMPIGAWDLSRMAQEQPSCFNSMVKVEKYRVTIEKIEEPVEIIQERLEQLWLESGNHHDWTPLEQAAARFNYKFKGIKGSLKNKK